ncbi:MAG: DEAD/DEAH box helicase [Planctomycetes bacterium]|nr:DEAD/DEAH box helicase [Planctomycetota bacterium]
MTFQSLGLHPKLLRAIGDLGYETPTSIQHDAIPPALDGADVLACAATGSGKTAAFLLPTLDYLLEEDLSGPRVLVLTPTRELAGQILADMKDLARHTKLRGAAVYGGVGMKPQEQAFRDKVEVIVACPGRLLDHMQQGYVDLADVEILILDEADRMLDMGFLPDVRRIIRAVPEDRQTLLFSATMPTEIARLADDLLIDPVRIAIERRQAPAAGVRQRVFYVEQARKSRLLVDIIDDREGDSVLVFTRTKSRANRLATFLVKHGIEAERIHGNRSQSQREKALGAFKGGRCRVLVATDVAARGIDVDSLALVVNFDCPAQPEDYIHRVGRTARAQKQGDAYTFVSPEEKDHLRDIQKKIGDKIETGVLPPPSRRELNSGGPGSGPPAERGERGGRGGRGRGAAGTRPAAERPASRGGGERKRSGTGGTPARKKSARRRSGRGRPPRA